MRFGSVVWLGSLVACGGDAGGIDVVVRGGDFTVGTPVYASIRVDEDGAPGRLLACGKSSVAGDNQFELGFSGIEEVPIYRFDVAFDLDASDACEDASDLVLFLRVEGALSGGTLLSPFIAPLPESNAPCFDVSTCDG